jgi:carbon storage regulator
MLVLSRSSGQQIMVGQNIVLTVVSLHGNRVRIGIEAPREIGVARHERWTPPELQPAGELSGTAYDLPQ